MARAHGQRGAVRWRWVLGAIVVAGLGAAVGTPILIERGSERLGDEVASRLAEGVGGTCKVGAVRLLSAREIELDAVGCVMDGGPLLGFAARRVSARFPSSPMTGSLPPAEELTVADLSVRLRDLA